MKNCIFWDAKKVPLRDKSGKEIPKEFHGVFSTKVPEGTPGARHYKGENEAANIKWDYCAIESTVIRGYLRWIDKVLPPFDGARAQIILFIESDKTLHKIALKYDATNLKDVLNPLLGLGKNIGETFLNVQYGVWKAKNSKGEFKLTAKNEIRWTQQLQFIDVAPKYSFEQWKEFSQKNGLQWEQTKKADGSTIWNADAELKYWDSVLVYIQQYLLKTGKALPFIYGSLTACENTNPSGGGNLTTAEIAECGRIYERIKSEYKMPFGRREEVDADSYDPNAPIQPSRPTNYTPTSEEFPDYEEPIFDEEAVTHLDLDNDPLPF